MRKKVSIVLFVMFFSQLLISCLCNCEDEYYEVFYQGVALEAYDISGFNNILVDGEVYKNAFGLGVLLDAESIQVADSSILDNLSDFGFSSTYAFSCDCVYEELYPINVKSVAIYSIDPITNNWQNVTDIFKVSQYYDEDLVSIDEYISDYTENEYPIDSFNLKLVDYEMLPNQVSFEVEVTLEDDTVFTSLTDVINFKE